MRDENPYQSPRVDGPSPPEPSLGDRQEALARVFRWVLYASTGCVAGVILHGIFQFDFFPRRAPFGYEQAAGCGGLAGMVIGAVREWFRRRQN